MRPEYDARHAFVYEKARGLVELLAPKAGERLTLGHSGCPRRLLYRRQGRRPEIWPDYPPPESPVHFS